MASDKVQFNSALRRWDRLKTEGIFSEPDTEGRTAILFASCGLDDPDNEAEAFEKEAADIQNEYRALGRRTLTIPDFTSSDAADIVQDPSVSTIIIIGNGTLSTIETSNGILVDWLELSEYTTHLKLGAFIQRQCGERSRRLSLPLGTFIMSRHDSVFAAMDRYLPPVVTSSYESYIRPIHHHQRLDYTLAEKIFSPKIWRHDNS